MNTYRPNAGKLGLTRMTKHIPKTLRERQEARERCQKANAIFSDEEVRRIRSDCDRGGASYLVVAQGWGCGMQTVRKIHRRETYSWVLDKASVGSPRIADAEYSIVPQDDANLADLAAASLERLLRTPGVVVEGTRERTAQEIAAEAEALADELDAEVLRGLARD